MALVSLILLSGGTRAMADKPLAEVRTELLEIGSISPAMSFFEVIADNHEGVSDSTALSVYIPELDATFIMKAISPETVSCTVKDNLDATFALLGKPGKEYLLAIYTPVLTNESLIEIYNNAGNRLSPAEMQKIGIREPDLSQWLSSPLDADSMTDFTRTVPFIPYSATYNPVDKVLTLHNGLGLMMADPGHYSKFLKPELKFIWKGKNFKAI